MENHKGMWCPYKKALFCQEGFCDECYVYKELMEKLKILIDSIKSDRK